MQGLVLERPVTQTSYQGHMMRWFLQRDGLVEFLRCWLRKQGTVISMGAIVMPKTPQILGSISEHSAGPRRKASMEDGDPGTAIEAAARGSSDK